MDMMNEQNGYGQQGNPYAQPQRPQQVPQGQQQGNPYAQPQRPQQAPQGQQQGNPYAQPQRAPQAPQGQPQGNPYAQPQRAPQAPQGQQQGNPYGQPQRGPQGQQINVNKQNQQYPQQAPQQAPMNYNQSNGGQPVSGWSMGGFMFGLPMGLAHGKWIMLLMFLPLANFVMLIVGGLKMHEWCYNSGMYNSVAEYNASMKSWDKAGMISLIVTIIAFVGIAILWGTVLAGIIGAIGSLSGPTYY